MRAMLVDSLKSFSLGFPIVLCFLFATSPIGQAAMAADTLRLYIEHGTVRHSVNFPDTNLPEIDKSCIRITVVNKNQPGVLSKITEVFANHNMNITQQINHSRGAIAYNVIDVDPTDADGCNLKDLQHEVTMLDGCLSTRVLFGTPGAGYARNIDGTYHV